MRRLLAFGVLAAAIGCGANSDGLVPVTGIITIDGQPGANTTIAFIPQSGTPGNGGTAVADAQGHYEIATPQGQKGLPAGKYKVIVNRRLNPDGSQPSPNVPPIEAQATETLQPKYSDRTKTELTATVPDTKVYDFAVQSLKKKS